ncbi:MAG: rRNA maturation RNase YbeY [Bacteroidota bacterium]|nr:rRNA maturation RNase YbeY [Bacteroidota bacterium]
MQKIVFHSTINSFRLLNKKKIRLVLASIFNNEGVHLESLNFVFCTDSYLLKINRDFLNHDFYTDIITFDLSEEASGAVTGEVYISIARVKDNALKLGVPFNEELLRVIFHGSLHLCGYKDKKKSEIAEMRQKEEQYLRLFKKLHSK